LAVGTARPSKAHDQEPLGVFDRAATSRAFDARTYRGSLPLSAEIADWLGQEIVSGRLPPGTRLVARELSERLGVSMTPIREAFRLVSGEGLVELSSRRGAWVAEINSDEVEDIYECRAALQDLAARQCAARASNQELGGLKEIADAMAAAFRAGDTEKCFELNVQFHDRVLAASKNVTAQQFTARLGRRTLQLRRLSLSLPGRHEKSVKVHQRIVKALCARNGVEAGAIMREQIMDAAAALIHNARDLNADEL
jgi:DNA-binding GntR family transcriptional regulator